MVLLLMMIYLYINTYFLCHVLSISDQKYQKYTFYYETYQYSLHPEEEFDIFTDDDHDKYLNELTPFDEFGVYNESEEGSQESDPSDFTFFQ